jgi:putative transcriptional regulator
MRNRTRELRARRGWSQSDLGDALALSPQTVNAIENGRYDPTLPLAFKLSAVFGELVQPLFTPVASSR